MIEILKPFGVGQYQSSIGLAGVCLFLTLRACRGLDLDARFAAFRAMICHSVKRSLS
jgi:hypothetical protein